MLRLVVALSCALVAGPATVGASTAAAAPGDVARELRRQQLFLTVAQTKSVQRRVGVRADGDWGSGTVTAMRRWQRRRGLAVTGAANVESLRAMGLRVASRYERLLWARRDAGRRRAAAAPSRLGAVAVKLAHSRLGTPYRSGGKTAGGFDCSGLVFWAYRQGGRLLPRRSFEQYKRGWPIGRRAIRPGDLVFFDAAGPGASHVAIAISSRHAISATNSGVVVHPILTGYWGDHYVGARRLA